jgi:SAM-dependent methyltransferase
VNEYDRIADFYDCEHAHFDEDIQFFLRALPPGPVLEVGSGTGRVAGNLARSGCQVHGIEPSGAMLERARQQFKNSANLTFSLGSLSDLPEDGTYASVILSLNTLWHLTDMQDQVAALTNLKRVMAPGALLLVDLTNPLSMADRGADGQVRERFRGRCGDGLLVVQSAAWDDMGSQLLELELTYDCITGSGAVTRTPASLLLRYLYRSELELMLQLAGFRLREVFGSYLMEPFTADSENILAVAALP